MARWTKGGAGGRAGESDCFQMRPDVEYDAGAMAIIYNARELANGRCAVARVARKRAMSMRSANAWSLVVSGEIQAIVIAEQRWWRCWHCSNSNSNNLPCAHRHYHNLPGAMHEHTGGRAMHACVCVFMTKNARLDMKCVGRSRGVICADSKLRYVAYRRVTEARAVVDPAPCPI